MKTLFSLIVFLLFCSCTSIPKKDYRYIEIPEAGKNAMTFAWEDFFASEKRK